MIGVPQPAQTAHQAVRPARPPSNIAAAPGQTQSISPMINGIPVELIEYFNIDIRSLENRDNSQLAEIYRLLKSSGDSNCDMLLKISEIERRIGSPVLNETRYGRIWSHLKINNRIEEMEKQKQLM